ncbi:MAG: calcium-binding protein [Geitlerinemataceae cyanobacterium]
MAFSLSNLSLGSNYDLAKATGQSDVFAYDALPQEQLDLLAGSPGIEKISLLGGNDEVIDNDAPRFYLGNGGDDIIFGYGGLDTLNGGTGNDSLDGGNDDDWLIGSNGNDRLLGQDGNDNINGGLDNDTLLGGAGQDTLNGLKGDDLISGDEDDDRIIGHDGNDTLSGGIGQDSLWGGNDDDSLSGDDGDDRLYGQNGNDTLSGDAGDDRLDGQAGNDIVSGGEGQDTVLGGTGNDDLSGDEDDDRLYGHDGNDTLSGGIGQDSLWGGNDDDSLSGDAGDDRLYGQNGNDTLSGGSGKDTVLGQDGDDWLSGDADNDNINGHIGNDTLSGGTGVDVLTGGEGNDIFLLAVGEGRDTITDFQIGEDSMQLAEGVLFSQLNFQVSGTNDTLIKLSSTGESIALLKNIRPFDINRSDFIQTTPDPANLGTNLNAVKDWSTQLPFLDHFKASRQWITQANNGDPGYTGGWGTNEYDLLDLDEHGWVKSLPAPEDAPIFTKVSTFVLNVATPDILANDKFVVLYDGEGTLEYSLGGRKVAGESTPGRDIINITTPGKGVLLTLTATDPNNNGDYLRNIRVVRADQEALYNSGEIFNPLFLQKTDDFSAIRFMDWMETNDSTQKEWNDRPEVEDASYALDGVPVEVMIELANELDADPWFNMPHQATDEYMTNFAQIVKEQLEPDLKAYVEFSNEMWNWTFDQTHYALEQARERWDIGGNGYMQWYGMRSAQTSDLWENVFGDEKHRLVNVISTQTAWEGLENAVLDTPAWVAEGNEPAYKHGIDAYAITGYFGRELGLAQNTATVESWLSEPDGGFSKAFEQLRYGNLLENSKSLAEVQDLFEYHANVAQERGLQLIAYEGGQHVVGVGSIVNNEALTDFFIELNRRPQMYDLYTELLSDWDSVGGTLFTNFSDIAEPRKWGSWGSLEYLGQDGSPKYDALMDFIETHPDPTP